MRRRISRLLRSPLAVTVMVLVGVAVALPVRPGFHPGEWYFVMYAAALMLPSAAWSRTVIHVLAFRGFRAAGVVLLSWCIPLSLYGVIAGPVWIFLGTTENDQHFASAGAGMFIAACAVAIGVVVLEVRRRREAAVRVTSA